MNLYPITLSFLCIYCDCMQVGSMTEKGLQELEYGLSHSHLKKLRVDAYNSLLIPILNGLKANSSVTELAVGCKLMQAIIVQ